MVSHEINDELQERAHEVLEYFTSHPSGYDKLLAEAVMKEDWDTVRYWVIRLESEMAVEIFHTHDLVVN